MLSIANASVIELPGDAPFLSLGPEEMATLTTLMERYDFVLLEIEALNGRIQELLDMEGLLTE